MTAVLRGVTALWLRLCAWRAGHWLKVWEHRVGKAEASNARYRLWCRRAGISEQGGG